MRDMPTLEDFGLDEKELLVEMARETMGKLIAAEKRLNGIKEVCRAWHQDEIEDYGALASGPICTCG